VLEFPQLGTAIPGRKRTHWVLCGKHRIIYRVTRGEIRVLRFLHVKQDFGRHLEPTHRRAPR